jgi:dTDP-4-dehydrorhamnose 3,5-epimerase
MKIKKIIFKNVFLFSKVNKIDNRGKFLKIYNQNKKFKFKIDQYCVSENTLKGTIRGLHYQDYPYYEKKIISVLKGSVIDVIVDIKKNSPTFMRYKKIYLNENSKYSIYIGPGYAHGFQTLKKNTLVSYLIMGKYKKKFQKGINYLNKDLSIKWPISSKITISKKDLRL